MGWAQRKDTDSYLFREEILRHLDLDIIGIADTHFLHDQSLEVEAYTWFGSNRKNIHIRAKKGSGGFGFLIKNNVMKQFSIMVES